MNERARAALSAAGIAALGAAVGLVGCARNDPIRIEGTPPPSGKAVSPSPAATSSPKVNTIALLKDDPKVSGDIKRNLKPCKDYDDLYPIETTYGEVTGDRTMDLVVNVHTCADGVGVGSYVYQAHAGKYLNVFSSENPPVWADITKGDLEVTQQTYGPSDSPCCPSGEVVTTYHWTGTVFQQTTQTRTDFGEQK